MGVFGLVSRGSRAAGMFVETAGRVASQENCVVGVSCSVRMPHEPVGLVITRAVHGIPLSERATARYGANSGETRDVDTVGVPGDWGYR